MELHERLALPNVKLSMELHHSMHTLLLIVLENINTWIIMILKSYDNVGSRYIVELHDLFVRLFSYHYGCSFGFQS
jgi:hypothetical protein